MWTKLPSGREHESTPEVAEYDNATESSLVLLALRDAILRTNFACRIVVHTECDYVAAAIMQHWPEKWQNSDWKSSKDKEVKYAALWSMILQDIEEYGHQLEAVKGKHEWSEWMRWNLPLTKPLKEVFKKTDKEL